MPIGLSRASAAQRPLIGTSKGAKAWVREYKGGYKQYNKLLKAGEKHNIEKVGTRLRSMMPWMRKRTVKGAQAAY